MPEFTDDLGRRLCIRRPLERIISLCPSITETLFGLGLDAQIAGVTRYCVHPAAQVAHKTRVGGTKRLRHDSINAIEPDLIIAEKEENRREDVEQLAARFPVYVADVLDYPGALRMIEALGALCQRVDSAQAMTADIRARFERLPRLVRPLRVAYMIWRKPYMCVAGGTYIDSILSRCGFHNAFAAHASGSRYPQVNAQELQAAGLDAVLLSSEPFPFADKHIAEFRQMLPDTHVRIVDGEAFSWYGAHMRQAADTLHALITELDR